MAIKFSNEQQLAIDSRNQNIIVSAGAGSGKTAVLTERIRTILLEGVKASELLVLTFTNAAAAEMKARIVKAMAKDSVLKYRTSEVDSAYITTFDSFSLSLVGKYHDRFNITENITIIDGSIINVCKRKIIDDLFLNRYKNHDENFECFIANFSTKDDSSLKEQLLTVANNLDQSTSRDEFLNNYINKYYCEAKVEEYIDELLLIVKEKLKIIEKNIEKLQFELNEKQYDSFVKTFALLISCNTYNEIKLNLDIKMPIVRNVSLQATLYKDEIKQCLSDVKSLCVFNNTQDIKNAYFESEKYAKVVIDLLKDYYYQIDKYKKDHEAFEFIDISKMAISLVKNNLDIQEEIKAKFKEILVDEYQDTNDLQEEFISYIANNNVYMVGDIKQSIYGFRNANPLIFKNKYDSYRNHDGGMKIDLNQNFRSNRSVLFTINQIFNKIMDDNIGQANFKEEHQMRFGLSVYDKESQEHKIKYVTYKENKEEYKNKEVDIFYVLKDIKDKIENKEIVYDKENDTFRACEYKDFAILAADSTIFDSVSKLLSYNHIPNLVFKNVSVNQGVIVTLLKNIIKLIVLDYRQEYNEEFLRLYYGVARSFIIQMSDEQLFDAITNLTYKETIFYGCIHELSNKIYCSSMSNILNDILEKFNIFDRLIEIGDVDENITRIEFLCKTISSMEKLDLTIFDFVIFIDDIYKNDDKMEFQASGMNENKVKIMTIHKSKGLEFPIVYFINNDKKFNKDELKDKIIYNNKFGLIVPYFMDGEGRNINYYLLKENNNISMISEKIRLLYVALTRAREQMIIVNPYSEKTIFNESEEIVSSLTRQNYNSFKSIYHSVNSILNDIKEEIDVSSLDINDDYLKPFKINPKEFIDKSDEKINELENIVDVSLKENTHASKEASLILDGGVIEKMKFGSRVHEMFEMVDFVNPCYDHLSKNEKQMICNFLNQDLMKNISLGKIYKEFEFIYEVDNKQVHGIIDLMIVYEDYIDIIDYKLLHVDDEAYINQLKTYQKYIENKSMKKTNLYLYSILKDNIKEIL